MEKEIQDVLRNDTTGAAPLARQFIIENEPDFQEFKKKYGGGMSAENVNFGYQFASACSEYTLKFITEGNTPNEKLEEGIKRFATAVLSLNDSEFAFSIDHLKNKLAVHVPEFSQPNKDGRELKIEIRQKIAQTINDHNDCNPSKRVSLIKVITDYDKIEAVRNRRTMN